MFKVNNKDTRIYSNVSIVEFEQVSVSWDLSKMKTPDQ